MAESWQQVAPLGNEDPIRSKRPVDVVALVAGIVFCVLAVGGLTGITAPLDLLASGILWVLLVGAGVALLVNELRRARRRSGTG